MWCVILAILYGNKSKVVHIYYTTTKTAKISHHLLTLAYLTSFHNKISILFVKILY